MPLSGPWPLRATNPVNIRHLYVFVMLMYLFQSGFITGGSDSQLIKWKDVTMDRKEQRLKEQEEVALEEQKLSNYIQSDQLLKALKLALKLEKPAQSLKIVQGILKKGEEGKLIFLKLSW